MNLYRKTFGTYLICVKQINITNDSVNIWYIMLYMRTNTQSIKPIKSYWKLCLLFGNNK